jgi:hypothetical protein
MTRRQEALKILSMLEKRGFMVKIDARTYGANEKEIKRQILRALGPNSKVGQLFDEYGDFVIVDVYKTKRWRSKFRLSFFPVLLDLNLSIEKNGEGPYCVDFDMSYKEIRLNDDHFMPKQLIEEFKEMGKTLGYKVEGISGKKYIK